MRTNRYTLASMAIAALVATAARADVFKMPSGDASLQFVTVGDPGNAPDTQWTGPPYNRPAAVGGLHVQDRRVRRDHRQYPAPS